MTANAFRQEMERFTLREADRVAQGLPPGRERSALRQFVDGLDDARQYAQDACAEDCVRRAEGDKESAEDFG